MSQRERDWLDWLKRARDGHVTQRFAAENRGITDRWVRSLLAEMKERGDAVVIHGLLGHPSNQQIGEDIRARSLEIIRPPDWHDFGPTFASEQPEDSGAFDTRLGQYRCVCVLSAQLGTGAYTDSPVPGVPKSGGGCSSRRPHAGGGRVRRGLARPANAVERGAGPESEGTEASSGPVKWVVSGN
jgi:hypothetical protein